MWVNQSLAVGSLGPTNPYALTMSGILPYFQGNENTYDYVKAIDLMTGPSSNILIGTLVVTSAFNSNRFAPTLVAGVYFQRSIYAAVNVTYEGGGPGPGPLKNYVYKIAV